MKVVKIIKLLLVIFITNYSAIVGAYDISGVNLPENIVIKNVNSKQPTFNK